MKRGNENKKTKMNNIADGDAIYTHFFTLQTLLISIISCKSIFD